MKNFGKLHTHCRSIFAILFGKRPGLLPISQQLDDIGFFDLIENKEKLKCIKELIDKRYGEDKWLIIPNDYYVSEILNISENKNGSSTSDFRAFEVYPIDMFRGNLESYLQNAKPVFEKTGLKFDFKDEKTEYKDRNFINHTITINNNIYTVFKGNMTDRGIMGYKYLLNFVEILNKVLVKQKNNGEVFILPADDAYVYCILSDKKMKKHMQKILTYAENKIE